MWSRGFLRQILAVGIAVGHLLEATVAFGAPQAPEIKWAVLGELDLSQCDPLKNLSKCKTSKELSKLSGKRVRMAGYMIPLEANSQKVSEFIFVPSIPACMHVPPPPPNQVVLVQMPKKRPAPVLMSPVWVTGKLEILKKIDADTGAPYQMSGESVEEFKYP